MTAIYYDTEFIENGRTIDLVSIGRVSEAGDEYYAVSSEFDMNAMAANPWLMANVWPSLPRLGGDARMYALSGIGRPRWMPQSQRSKIRTDARCLRALFDWGHPAVKPRRQIANEVRQFILSHPDPQLWAWYAAYDHVALAQLFGRMIDLPDGMPMFTCDLKQECVRLGDPRVPEQATGVHNALADARHNKTIAEFLRGRQP